MRKKIFTFLLALAASVGLMNAKVTWNSCNMSNFSTDQPYTLEGVTLRANASFVQAYCDGNGDEIHFFAYETGGFTFSNTLGKNFTKIEMFFTSSDGWGNVNLGSGWSFMNNEPVTWTGNASTVDLLKDEGDFGVASVKIVFHFEGDSQEPDPVLVTANTLQLVADPIKGSVAVTNLLCSGIVDNGDGTYDVPEGAEVTLQATPNEGYEFIGWKAGSVGCDFTDCGNALSTVDNPLTFDMYQEAAFMAEFAAVAPQPVTDPITPYADPQDASVYYSTFYDSNFKYELPTGVEAYVADLSGANLLLTKIAEEGEVIPANVAVILKSSVDQFTLTVSDADAVTFTAANDLQGSDTQIATPANCYVLAGTDGVVGFYHYTAANLNAHKAYVVYTGSNQAPRRMPFIFDQATGVENVQGDNVQSTKMMENGVLYIIKNGVKYNAQGQIVK